MEIVFVIGSLGAGGAERVVVTLANELVERGRSVSIVSYKPGSDFYTVANGVERVVLNTEGWNVRVPILNGMIAVVRQVRALRREIKRSGAETVVGFITITNIFVIVASVGLNCRVVISERNDPTRQSFGPFWDFLRKTLYRYADTVTANSHSAVTALREFVPASKVVYVPNPLILPKELQGATKNGPVVLCVGGLRPHKGHALVIRAFAGIGSNYAVGWRLRFVGDGPCRQNLEKLAKELGCEGRIEWMGRTDALPHQKMADIFVLMSEYEGTPNSLLEAMSLGVAVVVSDGLPGAMDYVEDGRTGLVVEAGNIEHLKSCLEKLMDDEELRKKLGSAARARMKSVVGQAPVDYWDSLLVDARS